MSGERPGTPALPAEEHRIEVELPAAPEVKSEFADASYWKVSGCASDLDELLADYE